MGVFATRSPFRPNNLGLSSVKLEKIEFDQELGPILHISGADLMNETPIYDIKPYLPYADSHPDAKGGFTDHIRDYRLQVEFPEELIKEIPTGQREALLEVLAMIHVHVIRTDRIKCMDWHMDIRIFIFR